MKARFTLATLLIVLSTPALATLKTVTLSVPGMTCAACPITIKAALGKVEGVTEIVVNYEQREAVVTFDDTQTSPEALTEATTNAGYPSTVVTPSTEPE